MTESKVERVEVYEDAGGEFRWRAIAGNNRIIATSGEGYVKAAHAHEMAASLFPGVPVEPAS